MKTSCEMVLEQRQKLFLSPTTLQNMNILKISMLELETYIQKELQENPLLEESEYYHEVSEKNNDLTNDVIKEKDKNSERIDILLSTYTRGAYEYTQNNWEETYQREKMVERPSLVEHLDFQLLLETKDHIETAIGRYLIGNLDEAGYLTLSVEEAAVCLNASPAKVEKILHLIQTFHPHGVGARNLAECIYLQLKHYGKDTEVVKAILEKHIEDLAKGRLRKIASGLNISIHEVQSACDLLRGFNPKPGLQYKRSEAPYIRPDILAVKDHGEYHIIVNDNYLPRLLINQKYADLLQQPELLPPETLEYLRKKMEAALGFIQSIQQRQISLYKMARCIVDYQHAFLECGIDYLRPLTMREVAEQVSVHESTVSRAVRNKYIQTPRGLFELKYFFGGGIESCANLRLGQVTQENKVSNKKVKHLIKGIISVEDTARPYNDNAIVSLLHEKGINVSRRTVVKYRQELGIPSISARKRY